MIKFSNKEISKRLSKVYNHPNSRLHRRPPIFTRGKRKKKTWLPCWEFAEYRTEVNSTKKPILSILRWNWRIMVARYVPGVCSAPAPLYLLKSLLISGDDDVFRVKDFGVVHIVHDGRPDHRSRLINIRPKSQHFADELQVSVTDKIHWNTINFNTSVTKNTTHFYICSSRTINLAALFKRWPTEHCQHDRGPQISVIKFFLWVDKRKIKKKNGKTA